MSINNHIDKLIEKNKHIKPVNQTAYHNGFLLLSETRALNELVNWFQISNPRLVPK